jgi:hypothetical protein
MKKYLKIVLIILFIGILFCFTIMNLFSNNIIFQKNICNFKFNLYKRDLCLLNIVEDKESIDICEDINKESIKNYCYLIHDKCEFILNNNYNYLCQRMKIRPHMWGFIKKPREIKINEFSEINECNKKKSYDKLYCIYNLIDSRNNITFGMHVCNEFNDELINGECMFQLQISQIFNLNINTSKKINFFNGFCKNIKNPAWRSECFFLLADELSYLDNNYNYLKEISNSCSNSNLANSFGCFNHVAINLPLKHIKNFCSFAKENERENCYYGYGYKIGTNMSLNKLNESLKICKKLSENLSSNCVVGMIWSLSTTNVNDKMKFFLNACEIISYEYKEICYHRLGYSFNILKDSSGLNDINKYCSYVPKKYSKNCIKGYAEGLDLTKKFNLKLEIQECLNVEKLYQEDCIMQLIYQINFQKYYINITKQLTKCDLFPLKYQNICKKNMLKKDYP